MTKKQIKFTGCRCEYRVNGERERTFEVDLQEQVYNEKTDLITCGQCQSWDKYLLFTKLILLVSDNEGFMDITVIHGAKTTEEPNPNKPKPKEKIKVICEQIFGNEPKLKETNRGCYFQQNGQWTWCVGTPIYLKHCDKNQAQELKTLFQSIQQDLGKFGVIPYNNWLSKNNQNDGELKAGRGKVIANSYNEFIQELDEIIGPTITSQSLLGPDYSTLKAPQQAGRQKTQASWTKQNISFVCLNCPASFPYDKSISSYLEARTKAKNELKTHQTSSCSHSIKDNGQEWWNEVRNSKTRIIKTCETCWGKVLCDKSIEIASTARLQVLSDLKYHQEHECHLAPEQRTIAIYHSPNQGGNKHAPINLYLLSTDDGIYSQDNDGETYQGTQQPNNFNWKPLPIAGLVLAIVGLGAWLFIRNKKKSS